jgi:hypothetical protein
MTGDSHLVLVLDQELDSLNRGGSGLGDSGGDTSHHEVDCGSSRKTKSEARNRDTVSDPSHDHTMRLRLYSLAKDLASFGFLTRSLGWVTAAILVLQCRRRSWVKLVSGPREKVVKVVQGSLFPVKATRLRCVGMRDAHLPFSS